MRGILEKMARYEKENRDFTIVFYGDSVTDGCFLPREKDFDAVWHARFVKLLHAIYPELRIQSINSGIGGISTRNSVERLDRDAISRRPDLVIVCLGLNDLAGDHEAFFTALDAIIRGLTEKDIPVVYLTPNMTDKAPDEVFINSIFRSEEILNFAKALAERQNDGRTDVMFEKAVTVAKNAGAVVCDAYRAWKNIADAGKDTDRLLANGINHPTKEMHALFAAMLLETVLMQEKE